VHKGRGQLETLLHAARELVGAIIPPVFETELREQRVSFACRVTTGQSVQSSEMGDLVASWHPWIEAALLGHVAPLPAVLLTHWAAVVPNLAAVGAQHPEHDSQQRGLARTVGPEQPGDHPRRDVEAHPVQSGSVAERVCNVVNLEPHRQAPSCTDHKG
jgi:hypothetical protein